MTFLMKVFTSVCDDLVLVSSIGYEGIFVVIFICNFVHFLVYSVIYYIFKLRGCFQAQVNIICIYLWCAWYNTIWFCDVGDSA